MIAALSNERASAGISVPMFSTKTRKKPSAPTPSGAERAAHKVRAIAALPITNPFVGAAGAAFLLVGSACALVAVAGDPRAGTPSVKIALRLNGPPRWRGARPQSAAGAGRAKNLFPPPTPAPPPPAAGGGGGTPPPPPPPR